MTRFTFLLPLALTLAACGGTDEAPAPEATEAPASAEPAAPAEPRMEGGVQVAELTVDGAAFSPAAVALRAGVPARLLLTRTDAPTCADTVRAPALGVAATAVPVGETVAVEFTPEAAGDYTLACGMDMVSARLVVQP